MKITCNQTCYKLVNYMANCNETCYWLIIFLNCNKSFYWLIAFLNGKGLVIGLLQCAVIVNSESCTKTGAKPKHKVMPSQLIRSRYKHNPDNLCVLIKLMHTFLEAFDQGNGELCGVTSP